MTSNFKEGMIVAEDCVFLGQLLVKRGTRLNSQDILKLNAFGVDDLKIFTDEISIKMEIEKSLANALSSLTFIDSEYGLTTEEFIAEALRAVSEDSFVLKELLSLKKHSEITFRHSINTTACSLILGSKCNLDQDEIYYLTQGALMHDIGKLYIPSGVLEKTGKLSDIEFCLMAAHTEKGYRLLLDNDFPAEVAAVCLEHHENFDGSGYPNNRKGNDISIIGRIVRVADVFDALCSQRSYKLAHLPSQALDFLRRNQERNFDPDVVQAAVFNFRSLALCYQR